MTDAEAIPALVSRAAEGGDAALELAETLYGELRRLAQHRLASERVGHTLSATALVHEVYLKLAGQRTTPHERAHFLAVASLAMRRVLVSHARAHRAAKRGSGERPVTLNEALVAGASSHEELVALDEALARLEQKSERQARAIVCKGYGGMTDAEIASVLEVSVPTVRRDLRMATAYLRRELAE